MHKGCVCCLGFRLSADGGPQLSSHRQRPDLVDWKTGHRLAVAGVSIVRSCLGIASGCCQPPRWNLHVAVQSVVCSQRR